MTVGGKIVGFTVEVPDPEAVSTAIAFCKPGELHVNLWTNSLVVVFYCWRDRAANEAGCRPFTSFQVKVEGGSLEAENLIKTGLTPSDELLRFLLSQAGALKDPRLIIE